MDERKDRTLNGDRSKQMTMYRETNKGFLISKWGCTSWIENKNAYNRHSLTHSEAVTEIMTFIVK